MHSQQQANYFISRQHPYTGIIILGDFNQLPDSQLRNYPMRQLVKGATRKNATLDKIYTNLAYWFQAPTVLPAITKSDHDSVIMVPTQSPPRPRRQTINLYRRSSDPNGKAMLCQCLKHLNCCLLYTSPSPRDGLLSRMPSSA